MSGLNKNKKKDCFPVLLSLILFSLSGLCVKVHTPIEPYILFPDPNYNVTVSLNETSGDIVISVNSADANLDLWKLNKSTGKYATFDKKKTKDGINTFEYSYPSAKKKKEKGDSKPVMDKTLMRIGQTSTILYYEDYTANWWNTSYPYRINITCSKPATSVYKENELCKGWLQFPSEYAPQENTLQLVHNNVTASFYRWYQSNNTSGHITRTMILLNTTLYPGYNKTYNLYYSTSNASFNSYSELANKWVFLDFFSNYDMNYYTNVSGGGTSKSILENGTLAITSDGSNGAYVRSNINFTGNYVQNVKAKKVENVMMPYFWDGTVTGANDYPSYAYLNIYNSWDTPKKMEFQSVISGSATTLANYLITLDAEDYSIFQSNNTGTTHTQYLNATLYGNNVTTTRTNSYAGLSGRNSGTGIRAFYDWVCWGCRYNDTDLLDFYPEPNLQEWGLQWYGPRKSGTDNRRIAYLRFSDTVTPVGSGYDIESANYGNDWLDHGIAYLSQNSLLVSVQGNQARNITIKQSSDLGATWNSGVSTAVLKNWDEHIYDIEIAPTEWSNVSLIVFIADKWITGGLKDVQTIGTDCTYTNEIGAGYFLFNHTSQAPVSDIWGTTDIIGCWHEFDFLSSNISHLSLIPTLSKAGYDYFVTMDIKSGAGYRTVSKFLNFNPGYQLEGSNYSLLSGITSYAQYPHAGADPIIDSALIVTMKNTTYTYNYSYWVAGSESEKGSLSVAHSYGTSAPNTGLWGISTLRAPNASSEWLFYDFFNDSNNNYMIGGISDTLTEAHTLTNVWNMTKSADNDALVRAYMDPQIVGIYTSDNTYLTKLLVPTYSITQPVLAANYTDSLVNFRFALDFVPVGSCEIELVNNSSGAVLTTMLGITYNNPYTDQSTDYFRYGVTRNGYYYGTVKCFHPTLNRWTNGSSNVFYINNTPSNVTGYFTNPTQGYNFISEGSSFHLRHIYTGALTGCNATIINIDTLDEQANLNNLYTYGRCNNASDILAYLDPHVSGTINYRLYLSYVNELGALIMATDPYTDDPYTDFSITWTASSSITDNYECQNMFFRHAYYLFNSEQKAGANHIAEINIPKNYMLQGCDDIIVTNVSWWQFYPYNSEFTKGNLKTTCRTGSGCAYTEEYSLGSINEPLYTTKTNMFNNSLCLVSVLTNVSENAYYKIDLLTATWDTVNASNYRTMTQLLSLGSFQINEIARSGVPYQTSYCDPRRITLALEGPNIAKYVWSIIENQTIRHLTNKDTMRMTVTSGLPAMYLALLANVTTIPVTLASCNNCTNLTYTIDGSGGGGGAGGWDDWAVEYGFDSGSAPTQTRPFSTRYQPVFTASLPAFVSMPDFSNTSLTRKLIPISLPANSTNCSLWLRTDFSELMNTNYLSTETLMQFLFGKGGNVYNWDMHINMSNAYISFYDLYSPMLGALAYSMMLTPHKLSRISFSTEYIIGCAEGSTDWRKVGTTLRGSNIKGDIAIPCNPAGNYGGCVYPDGGWTRISFFIYDFSGPNIAATEIQNALNPFALWNWISTPTNFVMVVMIIMIFMPMIMAGR